jgi:hypothetical protein
MPAIRRFTLALLALLLAAAPANALDILPALDGNGWDQWADLQPVVLEFDDDDWELFLRDDASEILPPAFGAVTATSGEHAGLLTQVWERP